MANKLNRLLLAVFLVMVFSFALVQPSISSTTVTLDAVGPLADIASFQFDVLSPDSASASDFAASLPTGWFPFPSGDTYSAFDGTGFASLPSGTIGTFAIDVLLGNWVLGNQDAVSLTQGVDYLVNFQQVSGNNVYSISQVPIPPTVLLLGAGLVGLVGIRRRVKS